MSIRAFAHQLRSVLPQREAVKYEGVYLPARHLRFCTTHFKDDGFFVQSADYEVERLKEFCGITERSAILDIGSGQGRLAIGLIRRLPELRRYLGVDVDSRSVDWCRRHITRYHPNFLFDQIDVQNARYNPQGRPVSGDFRLPAGDGEFTTAFLYSVFTHMLTQDVLAYLREIRRLLTDGGRVLMTAYVEPDVPDVQENPPGYLPELGSPSGPLHRVRYERRFFESLLQDAGLSILRLEHRSESITGQTVIVAGR